jgi:hypothetical protein
MEPADILLLDPDAAFQAVCLDIPAGAAGELLLDLDAGKEQARVPAGKNHRDDAAAGADVHQVCPVKGADLPGKDQGVQ